MRKRYLAFSIFVIVILMLMTFAEAYRLGDNDNIEDDKKLLSNVDNVGGDDIGNDNGKRLLANVDDVNQGSKDVNEGNVKVNDKVEGNGVDYYR